MNDNYLVITEKPDWVSWNDIHEVLWKAHEKNRQKGIKMRKPGLTGDEIKKELGECGVMLVALDGKKRVGSAALIPKSNETWYNNGVYGYMCFAGVIPEYSGRGIYKLLYERRETIAKEMGITKLLFDTHVKNKIIIHVNKENGFKKVAVKKCGDHYNAVLFKWLDGSPFSNYRCFYEFNKQKMTMRLKDFIKNIIEICSNASRKLF